MYSVKDRHGTKAKSNDGKQQVLSELASIDGSHWQLCLHPFEYCRDLNPDLSDLLKNPLATNPFFDPAVLAASRDRVTANRIYQLVLWEKSGNEQHARLSIPLQEDRASLFRKPALRSLTHPFAPLGNPLIAADNDGQKRVVEILQRFAELLTLAFDNQMPSLILDYLDITNPLILALNKAQADKGLSVNVIEQGSRATLHRGDLEASAWRPGKKRRREYARLEKKVSQMGDLKYERVTNPLDVLVRFEEYLLMEARSWKGRRGTSIHAIKRDAAFARQAVCDLAKAKRCEIFTMRLNDVAIASTILFHGHGFYYPWKTCFDENFAKFSPGTQLMLKLTEDITARKNFRHADSLAHLGHSWMSNLWRSENTFCTCILANDRGALNALSGRITFRGKIKTAIKRLLGRN